MFCSFPMLEANFNIVQYIYLCQLLLIERLVRVPTMYSKIGEILQKRYKFAKIIPLSRKSRYITPGHTHTQALS